MKHSLDQYTIQFFYHNADKSMFIEDVRDIHFELTSFAQGLDVDKFKTEVDDKLGVLTVQVALREEFVANCILEELQYINDGISLLSRNTLPKRSGFAKLHTVNAKLTKQIHTIEAFPFTQITHMSSGRDARPEDDFTLVP